jgi:hypothetical protein
MPTLMWHRSSGTTIGQNFKALGDVKYVQQAGSIVNSTSPSVDTDIRYFDLVDEQDFAVGRLFPDQHIFTIDDDELVAAMSYKSNRNWTLPKANLSLKTSNDGLVSNTSDLHVTYMFNNTSSGFTAGLHSQYHTCMIVESIVDSEGNTCGDDQTKDVNFQFPLSQLPFMSATGSTGWYADQFLIIAQKVAVGPNGEHLQPDDTAWQIMDFTDAIDNHTVGDRIDPANLESSTFTIDKARYNGTSPYSVTDYLVHDYINIPTKLEPTTLQFGDERFFFGNVCASGITNKYRTKFNFTVPPTQWNTTNNPTWPNSGQVPHISEVIIQDSDGNVVAVGKENLPIEKTTNTTIIIEIAFDM